MKKNLSCFQISVMLVDFQNPLSLRQSLLHAIYLLVLLDVSQSKLFILQAYLSHIYFNIV